MLTRRSREKRLPARGPVWVRLAVAVCAFAGASATVPAAANPYADHSDEELTRVASAWETLNTEERRDFVLEMRRRMADSGRKAVEVQRRFGRVVRGPDGSVVRIEQVVRIRPGAAPPAEGAPSDYGRGFEQRSERSEDSAADRAVVKVNKTVEDD